MSRHFAGFRRAAVAATVALLPASIVAPDAFACRIQWTPFEETEAGADVVVEAVVVAAEPPRKSFASWDYDYRIRVESIRRGSLKKEQKKELTVTFSDQKAHHRGEMVVCPVKHGTGIEPKLEVGKRYELFLEAGGEPELLLAREIVAETSIPTPPASPSDRG